MQEKDSLIKIKLTDAWPDVVALEVGRIGIAFAQLQREVYLAAKRKAGLPLPQWETKHRNDNFKRWCDHLLQECPDDHVLLTLVGRAKAAAEERHDLFHAIWGRHPDGHLGRWRRKTDLGIDPVPMQALLREISQLRDAINRHTRTRPQQADAEN